MIAIYDEEFARAKRGLPPPSLAAMKTAAYLKTEQTDQVVLITDLNSAANFNKVYFFSDKPLKELPKEVFLLANAELYGKYLEPLPQIIEHMAPDITIYHDVVQDRLLKKIVSTNRALQFLDSIYYQAYGLNGERLPLPPSLHRKRFYLYDEDFLQYENCWDIFREIEERVPTGIYTIKPIQCRTVKQFFTLREDYEKVSRSNKIILDYFVPLHHFDIYFSKYKLKLLGEITKNSEIYVYIGKNYSSSAYGEVFYLKNLYYCLNLIFSYYSRNIPIKAELFVVEDSINPYKDIFHALRQWTNHDNYDIKLSDYFTTKKLQPVLEDFIKNNPAMEIFFDKSKNDLIYTRGIWKLP